MVSFDMDKRKYTVLSRIAEAGKGRYAYLLARHFNAVNKYELILSALLPCEGELAAKLTEGLPT